MPILALVMASAEPPRHWYGKSEEIRYAIECQPPNVRSSQNVNQAKRAQPLWRA